MKDRKTLSEKVYQRLPLPAGEGTFSLGQGASMTQSHWSRVMALVPVSSSPAQSGFLLCNLIFLSMALNLNKIYKSKPFAPLSL